MEKQIAIFETKEIRKTFHDHEWWFVIVDVVAVLTDSENPSEYLKKLRKRDVPLSESLKGGDKLSPPFRYVSKPPAASRSCWRGTQRESSGSFSRYPAHAPSPSSIGSRK